MNISKYFLLLLLFSAISLQAQDSQKKNWKKLVKEAEEFEKLGDILRSASAYEEAYSIKKEPKLAYKAGKNYLESRHYAKAVKCLEPIKDDNNSQGIEKPGYFYACALKQSGQFAEARLAFESFKSSYKGSDNEKMFEMAEAEIQGCTFALRGAEITNKDIAIQHLDQYVNSEKSEFAPIPFDNNILYFSSTVSGVSKIYRTQKNRQGTWMTRQVPTIFTGKMNKNHFGNGSFTPDGKRFFFTQCDLIEGGKAMCEIYLLYFTPGANPSDGAWAGPVKLPDHINLAGFNATHPQISIVEDKEVLYFASDREGGVGGMDIWYSTRNLTDELVAFNIPKNLGLNVNTIGNEVSPFYHFPSRSLYYSSDGKVSTGGFDIYRSIGEKIEWTLGENIGFPLNSSADDLFYVVSEAHGGGYLISNRLFGKEKQSTTNDDIFYYSEVKRNLLVKGAVYSEKDPTKTALKDVTVKFYDFDGSKKTIVFDQKYPLASEYKFTLAADKDYIMEVICEGYQIYSTDISTKGIKAVETRKKDVALKPVEEIVAVAEPVVIVPKNSTKENPYQVPVTPPIDPKTGKPYAEGTEGYKAFMEADKIAKLADDRKVYIENGEIKPVIKEVIAVVEPKIDPKFAVVPETYNSKDNTFTLPKTVPIDPKTGKPYTADSDVYKAFEEANKIALQADDRKVYWDNGKLMPGKAKVVEPEIDPRFVVVPEQYNSKENPYSLPSKVPTDPKTGKPFVAGSPVIKFYAVADSVAKKADARKVYWNNGILAAVEKEIAVVSVDSPKVDAPDPRYVVVPKDYNSKENTFTVPTTVPIDPATGKPYAPGTKGYEEFMKADKIAKTADDRKVYWNGDELVAYNKPEPDPRYVVVPAEYNSSDNPFKLAKVVPNDPKTGKPYLAGSSVYQAFENANAVAKESPERKVYWDGNQLVAFIPIDTTPAIALTGQSFKVQVAAMKNLNTAKYQVLSSGDLSEYTVMYEKIQDGITRVVVVPKAKNEDNTFGFKNKEDALRALKSVIDLTNFKSSFVGIYEGDKRLDGLIRLDNQPKIAE